MSNAEDQSSKATSTTTASASSQSLLAFKLLDKDRDGFVTKAEMEKLSKTLSREQIEKAFAKFDVDGDGRLSQAEFANMMSKQ